MPKQIKDKTKATRMRYVMAAIEKHGKCSRKEIARYVGLKIDADSSSKSFIKAIYNDLNSLIGDNLLGVEYRERNGEIIPLGEEDNFINKRDNFYYILGGESEIDGAGLFNEIGIKFQSQKLLSPEWKISDVRSKDQPKSKKICVMFRINSKYICLETNLDEVPCKLIVAGKGEYVPSQEEIQEEFGSRASFVSISDEYLEKAIKNERLGHFIVHIYKTMDREYECEVDYIIEKRVISSIEKIILENRKEWEMALEERERGREESLSLMDDLVSAIGNLEISEDDDISEILENRLISSMGNTVYEIKKEINTRYRKRAERFEYLDQLSKVDYDDVSLVDASYSRVNDFIEDATSINKLKLPTSDTKVRVQNIGNPDRLQARKPPIKEKSCFKHSISRMESTEKFMMWTNLHGESQSLPTNIKAGPNLQIIISDFYPDSSYSTRELKKIKKKAA